jgi:hypothetical protein
VGSFKAGKHRRGRQPERAIAVYPVQVAREKDHPLPIGGKMFLGWATNCNFVPPNRPMTVVVWNVLLFPPSLRSGQRKSRPLHHGSKQETKMTRIALTLATLTLAGAAFAQAVVPDVPDTDGNGTWSLVELQAVWPDLTDEGFAAIDTGADGSVDATELQVALDGGVITAPAN